MNLDYYQLYLKYKARYLLLKQNGGQVFTEDLIYDNYSDDKALDEIFVRLVKGSGEDMLYKKIIKIKVGDVKGVVSTKNYRTGRIDRHQVNRNTVENLLKDIKNIWNLPDPKTIPEYLLPNFSLYIRYGDKVWPNKNHQSRLSKSDDPEDVYDNTVTKILLFE